MHLPLFRQRLERNLEWFKDELDAEFMNRLSDNQHPLTEFMRLHELDHSRSTASMSAALAVIRRDMQMSREELAKKLMAGYTGGGSGLVHANYYYEFGREKVQGHKEAAEAAHQALWDLQRVVNDVDRDGWPTKDHSDRQNLARRDYTECARAAGVRRLRAESLTPECLRSQSRTC